MKFLQLQFRARLDGTRDNLPPFLGATLRGAFGYVLKETVCQVRNTPCPQCYLKTACPYVSLFEGLAPDDREILRKYPNIPQPFVLVVPLQSKSGEDPACLEWGIRLFGKAVHHWPYVLHTFHQIGQRGLGKKQIPYEIQEVRDQLSGQVIWTPEEGSLAEPVVEITQEGQLIPPEQEVSTVKWRFESPVKLRKQGRVDALTIILAGQRRYKILDHFYGGQRHDESNIESEWVRAEEFVTEESRLRPFSFSRFSGRQQQRMQLSGLVGEITITGPWHKTGEWLNHISRIHLGKSTSFGFGNVTWEQQQRIMMKSNQSFVYELAAAGLLHDIGKVLQPAKIPLSAEAGKLEQMICPVFNGNYSHKHVLYTAHALYGMESNYGQLDRSRIERVAIYHHRPSTDQLDENLLTKADWLASGHDRQSSLEEEERTGLIPIVSTLSLAEEKQQGHESTDNQMLSTAALDFAEEAYLPVAKQSRADYQERCRVLSSQVLSALNRDYGSPEECLESLLGVTQGLLHTVPASRYRGHVPDVSLFDHSRMVAALAACLGMQEHENGNNANQIKGRFRFVTLGVGGIQNFIFRSVPPLEPADSPAGQSVNKGSAKRLRARSFYISLFSWIAARRILNELGLPSTNLVYDAGGHALLLIPEMSEVVELVNQVLAQIAAEIRDTLGGTLRFDYALSEPLLESDFHPSQFQAQLRKIETARANARLRFPDDRLRDGQSWAENGWIDNSDVSLVIDRAPFLKQLQLLGQVLPKSEFLALNSGDQAEWSEDLLGTRVSLHATRPSSGLVFALKSQSETYQTPLFLSGSHLPLATDQELQRLESLASQFDDEEPLQAGAPLPFHALAHLSTSDEGAPVKHAMLGVLKADVDLLGALFSYGFCSNSASEAGDASSRATLGRLAALSRSLDQFFKGFLIAKIRSHYRNLYTVFVGGDDLFLIGPWYDIVRFTRDLHGWFTRMTCQNRDVTFSAGIIFSKPATPVVHLADQAEAVLEEAKSRGRNRIAYGNVTLTWEQYQRALELHQLFLSCISTSADSSGVNPSMIYRLLKYSQQAMKCGLSVSEGGQAVKPSFAEMKWRAQLSYDLKRNLPHPTTETPQIQKFQEALMQISSPTDDAPVLYTAASLTLYFIRGESK